MNYANGEWIDLKRIMSSKALSSTRGIMPDSSPSEMPRAGCERWTCGIQLISERISRKVERGSQRFMGRLHG
jgi:hypothetical protein